MKDKQKKPLRVALLGMDGRSYKTMSMFLHGPCKGSAEVVEEREAEIDIIDADTVNSKQLLERSLSREQKRPIIVLSLQAINVREGDNIIFLKKPIVTDAMLDALQEAKNIVEGKVKKKLFNFQRPAASQPDSRMAPGDAAHAKITERTVTKPQPEKSVPPAPKKIVDTEEQKKTSKHTSTVQLDEKGFTAFIGSVAGVDLNDPEQQLLASYNPKDYFQGYVQSAYKIALAQKRVLRLNSGWKPLIILPHSREIWLEADDKLLRAFAGVTVNAKAITVAPVDPQSVSSGIDVEKIQEMDAFLWKLAIWSSKGRYPHTIDINSPIYLKRWPNFTRYIVTPHALRISALLVGRGPQTLLNIAALLDIELRYVYVFISAAYALGLAGQAQRQADALVRPEVPAKTPERKGLLNRIISKLRRG
ncbi:MAG: hypothetical protein ACU837_10960 [Gammaproteobacteria bacterium]